MEWVRAEAIRQSKLAFDDLVNQFNAAQNTPGRACLIAVSKFIDKI